MDAIDISVIIPIYNVEEYLGMCLESILSQTIEQGKIEVILVDDGSTDNSGKIASFYAGKYDNFSCIHQKNSGLSSARNAGLDVARGKYIYFLDSDDALKPHALETLYSKAVQNNVELVLFGSENFLESQDANERVIETVLYKGNYDSVIGGYKLYKRMYLSDDLIISACWVMVARTLIEKNHIRFIEGIQYEDRWYNFLVLLYAHRAMVVNIPLYDRRLRNGSIRAENNYVKKFQGMFSTLEKLEELSRDNRFQKGEKDAIELEIISISAHIINALVQIEYSKNDVNQLKTYRTILRKHQFWRKGCLTATALFGVKAGIWFRKHIGK